ncbi:uncharacterized protein DDB_G0283357-like isoform X2 [Teleopsis dalmanni]|uniref:uncharacterized protein DDB_G0283357-like isoform X2 n=1 Tax=Teleopsis dalmanni TaxID=139649 RepID=UPI0018CCE0F3|nr:uncharacterized protein DDB_G0283357-like isoform X2 [Teleopsis dalmanni]
MLTYQNLLLACRPLLEKADFSQSRDVDKQTANTLILTLLAHVRELEIRYCTQLLKNETLEYAVAYWEKQYDRILQFNGFIASTNQVSDSEVRVAKLENLRLRLDILNIRCEREILASKIHTDKSRIYHLKEEVETAADKLRLEKDTNEDCTNTAHQFQYDNFNSRQFLPTNRPLRTLFINDIDDNTPTCSRYVQNESNRNGQLRYGSNQSNYRPVKQHKQPVVGSESYKVASTMNQYVHAKHGYPNCQLRIAPVQPLIITEGESDEQSLEDISPHQDTINDNKSEDKKSTCSQYSQNQINNSENYKSSLQESADYPIAAGTSYIEKYIGYISSDMNVNAVNTDQSQNEQIQMHDVNDVLKTAAVNGTDDSNDHKPLNLPQILENQYRTTASDFQLSQNAPTLLEVVENIMKNSVPQCNSRILDNTFNVNNSTIELENEEYSTKVIADTDLHQQKIKKRKPLNKKKNRKRVSEEPNIESINETTTMSKSKRTSTNNTVGLTTINNSSMEKYTKGTNKATTHFTLKTHEVHSLEHASNDKQRKTTKPVLGLITKTAFKAKIRYKLKSAIHNTKFASSRKQTDNSVMHYANKPKPNLVRSNTALFDLRHIKNASAILNKPSNPFPYLNSSILVSNQVDIGFGNNRVFNLKNVPENNLDFSKTKTLTQFINCIGNGNNQIFNSNDDSATVGYGKIQTSKQTNTGERILCTNNASNSPPISCVKPDHPFSLGFGMLATDENAQLLVQQTYPHNVYHLIPNQETMNIPTNDKKPIVKNAEPSSKVNSEFQDTTSIHSDITGNDNGMNQAARKKKKNNKKKRKAKSSTLNDNQNTSSNNVAQDDKDTPPCYMPPGFTGNKSQQYERTTKELQVTPQNPNNPVANKLNKQTDKSVKSTKKNNKYSGSVDEKSKPGLYKNTENKVELVHDIINTNQGNSLSNNSDIYTSNLKVSDDVKKSEAIKKIEVEQNNQLSNTAKRIKCDEVRINWKSSAVHAYNSKTSKQIKYSNDDTSCDNAAIIKSDSGQTNNGSNFYLDVAKTASNTLTTGGFSDNSNQSQPECVQYIQFGSDEDIEIHDENATNIEELEYTFSAVGMYDRETIIKREAEYKLNGNNAIARKLRELQFGSDDTPDALDLMTDKNKHRDMTTNQNELNVNSVQISPSQDTSDNFIAKNELKFGNFETLFQPNLLADALKYRNVTANANDSELSGNHVKASSMKFPNQVNASLNSSNSKYRNVTANANDYELSGNHVKASSMKFPNQVNASLNSSNSKYRNVTANANDYELSGNHVKASSMKFPNQVNASLSSSNSKYRNVTANANDYELSGNHVKASSMKFPNQEYASLNSSNSKYRNITANANDYELSGNHVKTSMKFPNQEYASLNSSNSKYRNITANANDYELSGNHVKASTMKFPNQEYANLSSSNSKYRNVTANANDYELSGNHIKTSMKFPNQEYASLNSSNSNGDKSIITNNKNDNPTLMGLNYSNSIENQHKLVPSNDISTDAHSRKDTVNLNIVPKTSDPCNDNKQNDIKKSIESQSLAKHCIESETSDIEQNKAKHRRRICWADEEISDTEFPKCDKNLNTKIKKRNKKKKALISNKLTTDSNLPTGSDNTKGKNQSFSYFMNSETNEEPSNDSWAERFLTDIQLDNEVYDADKKASAKCVQKKVTTFGDGKHNPTKMSLEDYPTINDSINIKKAHQASAIDTYTTNAETTTISKSRKNICQNDKTTPIQDFYINNDKNNKRKDLSTGNSDTMLESKNIKQIAPQKMAEPTLTPSKNYKHKDVSTGTSKTMVESKNIKQPEPHKFEETTPTSGENYKRQDVSTATSKTMLESKNIKQPEPHKFEETTSTSGKNYKRKDVRTGTSKTSLESKNIKQTALHKFAESTPTPDNNNKRKYLTAVGSNTKLKNKNAKQITQDKVAVSTSTADERACNEVNVNQVSSITEQDLNQQSKKQPLNNMDEWCVDFSTVIKKKKRMRPLPPIKKLLGKPEKKSEDKNENSLNDVYSNETKIENDDIPTTSKHVPVILENGQELVPLMREKTEEELGMVPNKTKTKRQRKLEKTAADQATASLFKGNFSSTHRKYK